MKDESFFSSDSMGKRGKAKQGREGIRAFVRLLLIYLALLITTQQ